MFKFTLSSSFRLSNLPQQLNTHATIFLEPKISIYLEKNRIGFYIITFTVLNDSYIYGLC